MRTWSEGRCKQGPTLLQRLSEHAWQVAPSGKVGVPVASDAGEAVVRYLEGRHIDEIHDADTARSCHGAGRSRRRHQALKQWLRSPSARGVAEEAPGAYKDVTAVVDAAHRAGLSRKVARLRPLVCIKG